MTDDDIKNTMSISDWFFIRENGWNYHINYEEWQAKQKPFGISGCFRLRNEAEFMERAILSHLPYLDEAVLLVQPSDDGTEEIALRLEKENPKIKVYFYNYVVDWIDTPGFYEKDPDQPGHLVHMSNYALSLCKYSWICKVEGDVIALSTTQKIVDKIRANPDRTHYYGRVILNVAGPKCDQFSVTVPRNAGWDECFMNNDPSKFRFIRSGKWETIPMGGSASCEGWSALHMKRSKAGNIGWTANKLR